jgi:hypothetical protein
MFISVCEAFRDVDLNERHAVLLATTTTTSEQ